MLKITEQQAASMDGRLPWETLDYLLKSGAPTVVVWCGDEHSFDFSFAPLLGGGAYRVGHARTVGGYELAEFALRHGTGAFGRVTSSRGSTEWEEVNTSVEQFLRCCEATDRLWEMEHAGSIDWGARGNWLELQIEQIDPVVLNDAENLWSSLIWELKAGVV